MYANPKKIVENKLLQTHGDKNITAKVESKVAGLDQSKTGEVGMSRFKKVSFKFYPPDSDASK